MNNEATKNIPQISAILMTVLKVSAVSLGHPAGAISIAYTALLTFLLNRLLRRSLI